MKRCPLWLALDRVTVVASVAVVGASLSAVAQTAPAVPPKKTPVPVVQPAKVPAKPAAPATVLKPPVPAAVPKPAVPVATTKPAAPLTPAAQVTAVPQSAAVNTAAKPAAATPPSVPTAAATPTATTSPAAQAPANALTSLPQTLQSGASSVPSAASALSSGSSAGGDPRSPVAGQGVGTFLWPGGWTLIAYGCFRSGTRLFCDFDTTNQNNFQVNGTGSFWMGGGGVNLVDDGGKITYRHNAFFVGADGSQFDSAYIGQQPVAFIIEYDDVDARYTAISLVLGRDRMQSIPITLIDPAQPAGKMPARTSLVASAGGTAPAGSTATPQAAAAGANGVDKATSTVNNINDQKKKAQTFWKALQDATQKH